MANKTPKKIDTQKVSEAPYEGSWMAEVPLCRLQAGGGCIFHGKFAAFSAFFLHFPAYFANPGDRNCPPPPPVLPHALRGGSSRDPCRGDRVKSVGGVGWRLVARAPSSVASPVCTC